MAAPLLQVVEFRETCSKKGKGLFAKRDFACGDVILEEAPLVSCQFAWNELYKYVACEYCLRSLETAEAMARRLTENPSLVLPHPECCEVNIDNIVSCSQCGVLYCCMECQKQAWDSYHKCLCLGTAQHDPEHPVNRLMETWRNMHYPPETASIMLLLRMIAMVRQAEDSGPVLAEFGRFVQVTVNEEEHAVHKLLGKQFQEQLELLRAMVTEACYDDRVSQWFTADGFQSVFALLGTNQQGIGSSSVSVWVRNCEALDLTEPEKTELDHFIDNLYEDLDRVSGTFLNCEGGGLYRLQSACNHSCAPNAEIQFNRQNHILSLVAMDSISAEAEICISYLDECDRERSRHSRQKLLRENYLFNCSCPRCDAQADDDDVASDDDQGNGDMEEN